MNCRRADVLFSAAWEDELSVAEREALEAHIESCAACRASYDGFVRVQEAVQGLPRLEAANDFADQVWARIRATESAPRRAAVAWPSGGWLVASFRPALATAACLAVVLTVVAYVNRQPSPVRQTPRMAALEQSSPSPMASIPQAAPSRTPMSPGARLGRNEPAAENRVALRDQKKEVAQTEVAAAKPSESRGLEAAGLLKADEGLGTAIAATPGDTSAGLDSLFNHDYDVEFALDPVHLKRLPGQKKLTPSRPAPPDEVGKRASFTF